MVQSDEFHRSRISTVLGVVLTTNARLGDAPGNVALSRESTGLPEDSVANVSQVVTAYRRFLTERAGALTPRLLSRVENSLRLVLSL